MTMLSTIGEGQGVKIPKLLIKKAHLENCKIEFIVTKNGLLLKPITKLSRRNWYENIEKVILENKEIADEGILEDFMNLDLENSEWEW